MALAIGLAVFVVVLFTFVGFRQRRLGRSGDRSVEDLRRHVEGDQNGPNTVPKARYPSA